MKKFIVWAIIFYIKAVVFFAKGYDKVTNYYSSDNYSDLNVNAYVGGDAYNYIINANYLTANFVVGGTFVIVGTMILMTGSIVKAINSNKNNNNNEIVVDKLTD
jgi:hypothetical protein